MKLDMMNTERKLVLGTVQFGVNYGINNLNGKVCKKEVINILKEANKRGIRVLDTSAGYGDSESLLGEILSEEKLEFNIVSKYLDRGLSLVAAFDISLKRLRTNHLYGYLIHHFEDFINEISRWDDMRELKARGKVDKIGFSLYNVKQLQYLLDHKIDFDIVQFPYNIFDRQFEPYFQELRNMGVEIHTRSCFLQGLFFKDIDSLSEKLLPLRKYLIALHTYCNQHKIPIEQIALNYVAENQFVDGALIGVDTCIQLKSNIESLRKGIAQNDLDFISSINVIEKELLNPVNWK